MISSPLRHRGVTSGVAGSLILAGGTENLSPCRMIPQKDSDRPSRERPGWAQFERQALTNRIAILRRRARVTGEVR